ncbi:TetR family transcriptional regulator [Phenylobacterium montanum]|uniref:TetR family transcriptional regulator n=2 Tax=Phenylobacterium montanum TaxID=2823693 RepID=A0A975IXH0_9CAUL|nr:TetR family transcriptional regulator [Caulobacter sp. S6]
MVELVQEGQIAASAEQVAERAQVGLRTVFRHFNDMDSLFREMSLIVEDRVAREIEGGQFDGPWPERLAEVVRRRAALFELITPFKRAEASQRHRSRFLEQDIQRLNGRLRELLREIAPPEIVADAATFEALDLLFSFEAWDRLRREQRLSPDAARAVLLSAAQRLAG